MSTTMTIRLEPELKERLDKLATATHRSKSFLASEALREFVELNEWQIQETLDAKKEEEMLIQRLLERQTKEKNEAMTRER